MNSDHKYLSPTTREGKGSKRVKFLHNVNSYYSSDNVKAEPSFTVDSPEFTRLIQIEESIVEDRKKSSDL